MPVVWNSCSGRRNPWDGPHRNADQNQGERENTQAFDQTNTHIEEVNETDPSYYQDETVREELAASLVIDSNSDYLEEIPLNHAAVTTSIETTNLENSRTIKRSKQAMKKLGLIPLAAGLLAIGGVGVVFAYEQHQTHSALAAYHQGETYALKGDYQKAAVAFKQSLKQRTHFESAQQDLQVVTLAQATTQDVTLANALEKKGNYDQSLSTIQKAETHLANYKGPLITTLSQSLSKARMVTSVAQLRDDMKGKTSIADLAPVLQKAENLDYPEAKQIADEIRKQIANISYKQATDQLDKNNFSDATATITDGLKYAPSNDKLKSLKDTVAKKQKAFENAEQAKMEQAMVAAAQEKANNKTNAVKLVDISTSWDAYGDLSITGSLKSIATVPISSVLVSYTIKDSSGNEVNSGQVYIDQDVLYPNDTATFEDTDYGLADRMSDPTNTVTATVTGATWYLGN